MFQVDAQGKEVKKNCKALLAAKSRARATGRRKTKRIYASTKMTQKRQPKRVLLYIFVLILKLSFGGIFVLDFLDSRLKSDFCLHLNFRAKISKYLKFCAKISHEFLSALNGLSLASLAFL